MSRFWCFSMFTGAKTASQWKDSIPKILTNKQLRKMYRRCFLTFPLCFCFILTSLNKFKADEASPVFSYWNQAIIFMSTLFRTGLRTLLNETFCFDKDEVFILAVDLQVRQTT